jgi:hypothetical protein
MKIKFLNLFLILIFLISIVSAAEDIVEDVGNQLIEAEEIVNSLEEEGFNIARANDTLKVAKEIYDAQSKKRTVSDDYYDLVLGYIGEIKLMEEKAYIARDETLYAYSLYNETKREKPEINLSAAEIILSEMQFEFESERYEEAFELARKASSKIVEIEGQYTALNLAYATTTRTIRSFIVNNWMYILAFIVGFTIFSLLFKNRLVYYKTKYKIKKLYTESQVLEDLIKNTQLSYFKQGAISEETYRIRIRKFSEIIRDINRKIPLLKEELAKRKKEGNQDSKKSKKARRKNSSKFRKSSKEMAATKHQNAKLKRMLNIGDKANKKLNRERLKTKRKYQRKTIKKTTKKRSKRKKSKI